MNSDTEVAENQNSFSPLIDEANELLESLNKLFVELKDVASQQISLKTSLTRAYGSSSFAEVSQNVTKSVNKLPKFVEDCCTRFHTLSAERLKIVSLLSDRLDVQSTLHNINCLLISSLYWLRIYVRETVAILPYLIDVTLALQDIHNIVSGMDAVEKVIQSGSLKQCFVSAIMASSCAGMVTDAYCSETKMLPVFGNSASMSVVYSLMLEPSSSLTLSKALNCFADVRAQLTSNKLITSLQTVLNPFPSHSTAGALQNKNAEDSWSSSADDSPGTSPKFPVNPRKNRRPGQSNKADLIASTARKFQSECSSLIDHELRIARSLIDCFSQSTGFVQALSKKTLRKSISMDSNINADADDIIPSKDHGPSKDEYSELSLDRQPSRPGTSKNGRRPKSVIWVDAVDIGVRSRLESSYSKWYFGRLKSAILGRCLFAMEPRTKQFERQSDTTVPLQWSLDWREMRKSCDLLLKIIREGITHGPPLELLQLVLSSALLRSYEMQYNTIIDNTSTVLQEERLFMLEKVDDEAPECQTECGARIYRAISEVAAECPVHITGIPASVSDQLLRLHIAALKSLLEYMKQFVSYRTGVFLARKSYTNFLVVQSEISILLNHVHSALSTLKGAVNSWQFSQTTNAIKFDFETLLALFEDVDNVSSRYRGFFIARLNEDVVTFLGANMPLTATIWRKKSGMQRQKTAVAPDHGTNDYVAFSLQPHPYAFGLFRTCFSTYSLALLSGEITRICFFKANAFVGTHTCQLFFECITSMFLTWLKFILDKRIKFSPTGARQLEADFQNVQFLIEQQISAAINKQDTLDPAIGTKFVSEFRSLPIVHQLRSVIFILLSKSPESQQSKVAAQDPDNSGDKERLLAKSNRTASTESDPLVDSKPNGKRGRRRKRGVAPLSEQNSESGSATTRLYPVPFGADAWLQLVDDSKDRVASRSRFLSNDNQVTTVCLNQCAPRIWRRRSPTPL